MSGGARLGVDISTVWGVAQRILAKNKFCFQTCANFLRSVNLLPTAHKAFDILLIINARRNFDSDSHWQHTLHSCWQSQQL